MKVVIRNFDKFMGRRDIKEPWWFKLSNKITEDPELYDLTGDEFKAFIYVLCMASRKRSQEVVLIQAHAEKSSGVSWPAVLSMLQKVSERGIIAICTRSGRDPAASGHDPSAIRPDANAIRPAEGEGEGDQEGEKGASGTLPGFDHSPEPAAPAPDPHKPHWLVLAWNHQIEVEGVKLPKVDERRPLHRDRARKLKRAMEFCSDPADWVTAIGKIVKSDFCLGKSGGRGWKATFDWLVQDGTLTKVLEGQYDNVKKKAFEAERDSSHSAEVDAMYREHGMGGMDGQG